MYIRDFYQFYHYISINVTIAKLLFFAMVRDDRLFDAKSLLK